MEAFIQSTQTEFIGKFNLFAEINFHFVVIFLTPVLIEDLFDYACICERVFIQTNESLNLISIFLSYVCVRRRPEYLIILSGGTGADDEEDRLLDCCSGRGY